MTYEPAETGWKILGDRMIEMKHVRSSPQPHRLPQSKAGHAPVILWGGTFYNFQEDFAPFEVTETPIGVEALDEVLQAIAGLKTLIGRLAAEQRSLQRKVAELSGEIEALPISRTATIHELGREGLFLISPIQIVVEEYPEEVVAKFPEVGAFATADNEFEAIELLKADIAALYFELSAMPRTKMGRVPRRWIEILSGLVRQ